MTTLKDKLAAATPTQPPPAPPSSSFENDMRVAIATASYNQTLNNATGYEQARPKLSYFAATTTLGILGWYGHLMANVAAHPANVTIANWLWPAGLLLLIVLAGIGQSLYKTENTILAEAEAIERRHGVERGDARIRIDNYHDMGFWIASRVDISTFCCGLVLFGTMLIHHWTWLGR